MSQPRRAGGGLTDVPGVKVGHETRPERLTGCTVILTERGVVGSVDVRGSAPGTIETDLLNPINTIDRVHAIFLSGGSAFGLDVATGVRRFLSERGAGFHMRAATIPVVPGAILYDFDVGDRPDVWPDAETGYRAAAAATEGLIHEGNIGAGAGATVGKLNGRANAMKGGVGTASLTLPDGLVVAALVAVNAMGDIVDPATGQLIAGARTADGRGLADARVLVRAGHVPIALSGQSTTIGVVATNAGLTKVEAAKMAQMAHDGLARAISPAHTPLDGDTIFSLATGTHGAAPNLAAIGCLAAEMMAEAIVRAVRQAVGIPGYPAARDLSPA